MDATGYVYTYPGSFQVLVLEMSLGYLHIGVESALLIPL